jgi:4-amino-4-deoxy-L-arabinose transferase-like glycosyltransferase
MTTSTGWLNTTKYGIFIGIIVVYVFGMFIDVMDTDAAQYASIAREMIETGNYLHFKHRFGDYLDKPPLLFWLSAVSMKIFGISNFAYKLPSVLVGLLCIYSVYRLMKIWYNEEIAYWSALILASSQTFFLIQNDIRTDTLQIGFTFFALWQLVAVEKTKKWKYIVGAGVGIGFGMLAKGPMSLMLPILALGSDVLRKMEWKRIFNWRWLVVLGIAGIMLIPMLIAQHDMYGMKAIRFFFWSQSFGRLTGESPWKNDAGYFFLLHSYLWAFAPWTVLWVYAYIKETLGLAKKQTEYVIWGSFTFVFIALSFSNYKLPHYIYIVVPLGAMLTAKHIIPNKDKIKKFIAISQYTMNYVIFAFIFILLAWIFPAPWWWFAISIIFFVVVQYLQWVKKQILISSIFSIITLHIIASLYVYPILLRYQSTHEIANYVHKNMPKNYTFATYSFSNHSLDFYTNQIVPFIGFRGQLEKEVLQGKKIWLYMKEEDVPHIQEVSTISVRPIYKNTYFMVANMSLDFILPHTRTKQLEKRCIVEVTAKSKL